MQRRIRRALLGALLSLLSTGIPAYASPIVFNFDSLADGASNLAIQNYMRNQLLTELGLGNAVTVTGAGAEKNYTGDSHVVGPCSPVPCSPGDTVTSLTLGNSNQGVQHALPWDTFIYNSDAVKITMEFTFPIHSVSFDYEIFPNGSCGDPNPTCSVWPDFTFKADGSTVLHANSLDPSAVGYPGLYTHSPISGPTSNEKAPQLLAVSSEYIFPSGVTKLEFYDWPERIGVDNLTITTVPEPGTLTLLGFGVAALSRKLRRRRVL